MSNAASHCWFEDFRREIEKKRIYAKSKDMTEEEDPVGWFPASRVFPDDPDFRERALSELKSWHRENESQNYLPPLKGTGTIFRNTKPLWSPDGILDRQHSFLRCVGVAYADLVRGSSAAGFGTTDLLSKNRCLLF